MKHRYLLFNLLFLLSFVGLKAQTWTGFSYGVDRQVNSLAVYDNQLFVAGDLDSVGYDHNGNVISVNNIASWNGTAWSAAGEGVLASGFQYPSIYNLMVYNNELYAVGFVTQNDGPL